MIMEKNTTKDFILSKFILEVLMDVVIVVGLVLLVRAFVFAPFQIHGPSMCDNFNVYGEECINDEGEFVITSRLSTWDIFGFSLSGIQRGDVIIFQAPYGEKGEFYIKRVIGLPGDELTISEGYVAVNGEKLDEAYLNEENQGNTQTYRTSSETYEVPDGSYFVMGDNRVKSSDSRRCFKQLGCNGGSSPFLDADLIKGEVKVVIYPLTHFRFIGGFDY